MVNDNHTVTKGDLKDAVQTISVRQAEFREDVRIGLEDIKDRQNRIDARIDEHDRRLLDHSRLLSSLGENLARVSTTVDTLSKGRDDDALKPGISRRDLKVASAILIGGGALIQYGPKIVKMLSAIGGTP